MEKILYEFVKTGEFKINSDGTIWKIKKRKKIRAEHRTPAGYLQLRKMISGKRYHACAHRVVWHHFNGPIPKGMTINHKNGIKDYNHPKNLELMNHSEQIIHAMKILKKHQRLKNQSGEKNHMAKLTDPQVTEIRKIYAEGQLTMEQIAKQYKVSLQTISDYVRGKRRKKQGGPTADYTHMRQRTPRKRDSKGRFI